jgi:hypothetical protein
MVAAMFWGKLLYAGARCGGRSAHSMLPVGLITDQIPAVKVALDLNLLRLGVSEDITYDQARKLS